MRNKPGPKATHKPIKIVRTVMGVKFTLEFGWHERLGDIYMEGARNNPVDCVQVHEFDWETGTLTLNDRPAIRMIFEEWILEDAKTFIDEMEYL